MKRSSGGSPRRLLGLRGPAKAWKIEQSARPGAVVLVVARDVKSAETLHGDLSFFVGADRVAYFPPWEILPFESVSPQTFVTAERLRTLFRVTGGEDVVVVAPAEALAQRLPPWEFYARLARTYRPGDRVTREAAADALDAAGFVRVPLVENVGDFSVRGGVVDLYPSTSGRPLRLEFFDDEIESIRSFEPETQRSTGEVDAARVLPVREWLDPSRTGVSPEDLEAGLERLRARAKETDVPPRESDRVLESFRTDTRFPGGESLQPLLYGGSVTPLSLFPASTVVYVDDDVALRHSLDTFAGRVEDREERFVGHHVFVPPRESLYATPAEVSAAVDRFRPYRLDGVSLLGEEGPGEAVTFHTESHVELVTKLRARAGTGDAFAPLAAAVKEWRAKRYSVALVVGSPARAERLAELLRDVGIDPVKQPGEGREWVYRRPRSHVALVTGNLSGGVVMHDERLVFVAENDLFRERSSRAHVGRKAGLKKLMSTLARFAEGGHVVHADYGIGVYRGLKHRDVEGKGQDFLHVEYADSSLYVPVQSIGKLQKYVGPEGEEPSLDKLGSTRWLKTKGKVREAVAALAGDLVRVYAARSVAKGWRYEPWGAEDERFADTFPFDETADQLSAINETISDMASDRPMDRLVCGDVGFGKTEVAVRAAFKCVQHQRQVGILVPTTILVEQHARGFRERFADYPVRVEAVSRFYSAEQNRRTLEGVASGDVDVVIGTHRLLQKDVTFRDLGLLVVDEEHRFGVKQKEVLKSLKTKLDVLTLTATPIPRTLHMSLLGIRDVSVISTPPVDRKVIRTYVAEKEGMIIRDALARELERGGQAFFLHNRVQSIAAVAAEVSELLPGARVAFAHGQMPESELERIMDRFVRQETDVLVTTTIVESGLDVPNANTIIVDQAHLYGLAQLYQIRGRVGRGKRQAYAYLLVPKGKKLTGEAAERLKVLQSLDELGVGFNLALRDMEIRGAGNLLGKEQSGNVTAVGFETYTTILKEAVAHLRGDEDDVAETVDPEVKLGVEAYLPDYYIPDVTERLVMYQRLAAVLGASEAQDLREEMADRFGPLPREADTLVDFMRFRGLLRRFAVVRGELSGDRLFLSFGRASPLDPEALVRLVTRMPHRYKLGKNSTLSFQLAAGAEPELSRLYDETEKLLAGLTKSSGVTNEDVRAV